MATKKTYILAPNFSYHPETSICLGDIIQYPDDPTKTLSSNPDNNFPPTETHIDYEVQISNESNGSISGSIWSRFFEYAGASIGAGNEKTSFTQYTIERMETIYFQKQPTCEEVAERIRDGKVQAFINSGLCGKKPVFMITGLKVARGFKLVQTTKSNVNAQSALEIPIPMAQTAAGLGLDASRSKGSEQTYRTEHDIVFAYQLHIVKHKGLKQSDLEVAVHNTKAAFLNKEKTMGNAPIDVEIATEPILRDLGRETKIETIQARDESDECFCLSFSKFLA